MERMTDDGGEFAGATLNASHDRWRTCVLCGHGGYEPHEMASGRQAIGRSAVPFDVCFECCARHGRWMRQFAGELRGLAESAPFGAAVDLRDAAAGWDATAAVADVVS